MCHSVGFNVMQILTLNLRILKKNLVSAKGIKNDYL